MNFGKAKKILIFLFLIINIFLIIQLSRQPDQYSVSEETKKNTMQIAQKNGVTFLKDSIPESYSKMDYIDLLNLLSDKPEFEKNFQNVKYNADGTFYLKVSYPVSDSSASSVLEIIKKHGFESYNFVHSNTINNPVTKEKKYIFTQVFGSYPIEGASLHVFCSNNRITKIEGNIYQIKGQTKTNSSILSPMQTILTFSNSVSYYQKKAVVSYVHQGYYIPVDAKNYKNITASPCYILNVNQNKYYYDAFQNTFLYMISKDGAKTEDIKKAFSLL